MSSIFTLLNSIPACTTDAVTIARRVLHVRLRYSAIGNMLYRLVQRRPNPPKRVHGLLRTESYLRRLIASHGGTIDRVEQIGDYRIMCVR